MPWVAFRILFFGILEPADKLDSFLNSATFCKTQAFPQPPTKASHLGESVEGAVDKDGATGVRNRHTDPLLLAPNSHICRKLGGSTQRRLRVLRR